MSDDASAERDTISLLSDLRDEVAALAALVTPRSETELEQATPFQSWRARDAITHLAFIDRLATLAVTDATGYAGEIAAMREGTAPPPGDDGSPSGVFKRLSAYARRRVGQPPASELVQLWRSGFEALARALQDQDSDRNLNWFGRPMKLGTLVSARQMEVWAYGQDVFDLYRVRRTESDRLRRVADFAIRTHRFSFANRGLSAPPLPAVELAAPSGVTWRWGSDGTDRISGSAIDFCLVATQRRNVADTQLLVNGDGARAWMQIAQCISGPPMSGPAPGERVWP